MYSALTQAAIAAIRKIATNPATRKQLGKVAATYGAKIAKSKLSATQKQRAQQALAVEMARQIEGGQLSYRTLLDGKPHTVVWADGTPIQAFPECKGDLEKKLIRHRRDLLVDPPEVRPKRSRAPWSRHRSPDDHDVVVSSTNDGSPDSNGSTSVTDQRGRVDEAGAAYAGSQLQTQLWVNQRADELNEAIRARFPDLAAAEITWRSPLAEDGYVEYSGSAFLRALGLDEHQQALRSFWPARGPQWDALAVLSRPGIQPGVLLVEGKSYPDEMLKGSPTASGPGSSNRRLIDSSLAWTRGKLGAPEDYADDWSGALYQNANRVAHLLWLREHGVDAWLVHLLFVGDKTTRPTTEPQWKNAAKEADRRLGLPSAAVPFAGHLLLSAGSREDRVM